MIFRLFYLIFKSVRFLKKSDFLILRFLGFFVYPVYRLYCLIIGVDIPVSVSVGRNFYIAHMVGTVINAKTIIGNDVFMRHCTTIGNNGKNDLCPIIGNNVNIGSNCCIIGGITIGNNVIIGAGSIVITDIPSNSNVVGNPGRVVKKI